jgi:tyrosine-protein kinase Etk/Wzc
MDVEPLLLEGDDGQGGQSLDLRRYVIALKRRWWLAAIIAVVIAVPWIIYVKNEKPLYQAMAVIRFKSYEKNPTGVNEPRIQELTSRSFAERVVQELGLTMSFVDDDGNKGETAFRRKDIFEEFTSTPNPVDGTYVLRLLSDGSYTLSQISREDETVEKEIARGAIAEAETTSQSINGFAFRLASNSLKRPAETRFKISPFRKTVESLREREEVDVDRSGTLMTIQLTDTDPDLVTQTVNNLASIFVRESGIIKSKDVSAAREVLEEQWKIAKSARDEASARLREFQQRSVQTTSDNISQEIYLQLTSAQRRLEDLKNYSTTVKDLLARIAGLGPSTDQNTILDRRYIFRELISSKAFEGVTTIGISRERLKDLEAQYDDLSRTSAVSVRAKETLAQIEQVQAQVEKDSRAQLIRLDQEISRVENQIAGYNAKLRQAPVAEFQLSELQRDLEQKEKIYTDIDSKYQAALINEKVTTEAIDILDRALVPELPINANKKVKAAGGAAFAVFFGVFVVLALELLDRSIKTIDDVRQSLKVNVLGAIPQIDFAESYDFQDGEKAKIIDQQLVTHDYSPTPIGEAYRSLRTNIMFSKSIGRIQTMCITSTSPGDGKSFTAANLAITMAQQKSSTLLIDCDLRRGVLHNTFGVPKEPGFTNFLTSSHSALDYINETHIPNLSIISCGSLIPNPSELLGSHQMRRFLDEMRRKFDLIVFDTPPLNAATDAVVIGTQVDATMIVIRAGKTDRSVARQKLELFHNVPAKVIGVVLNGTSADFAHEGYSYYHY